MCEVRDWRQPLRGQRTIYLAKVKGYCGRLLKRTPAVNAYLQNSKAWTEWHDDFDLKYRILGMVNPSISYRLDKAVTEYDSVYFDITIMNGAFAGTHAMGAELAS